MVKITKNVENGRIPVLTWPSRDRPFSEKILIFRDTRDHPEHDAKNCLSLPSPSSEKPLAEIDELKNNRP